LAGTRGVSASSGAGSSAVPGIVVSDYFDRLALDRALDSIGEDLEVFVNFAPPGATQVGELLAGPMHAPSRVAKVGTFFMIGESAPSTTDPLAQSPNPPARDFAIEVVGVRSQSLDMRSAFVYEP
jgi:hypothetical protein